MPSVAVPAGQPSLADLLLSNVENNRKVFRCPMDQTRFDVEGLTLYKRLALIAERRTIVKVFYPVFPPDRNAEEVVRWLAS